MCPCCFFSLLSHKRSDMMCYSKNTHEYATQRATDVCFGRWALSALVLVYCTLNKIQPHRGQPRTQQRARNKRPRGANTPGLLRRPHAANEFSKNRRCSVPIFFFFFGSRSTQHTHHTTNPDHRFPTQQHPSRALLPLSSQLFRPASKRLCSLTPPHGDQTRAADTREEIRSFSNNSRHAAAPVAWVGKLPPPGYRERHPR